MGARPQRVGRRVVLYLWGPGRQLQRLFVRAYAREPELCNAQRYAVVRRRPRYETNGKLGRKRAGQKSREPVSRWVFQLIVALLWVKEGVIGGGRRRVQCKDRRRRPVRAANQIHRRRRLPACPLIADTESLALNSSPLNAPPALGRTAAPEFIDLSTS